MLGPFAVEDAAIHFQVANQVFGASFSSNRQSFCSARLERTATLVIGKWKVLYALRDGDCNLFASDLLARNPLSSQVAVGF